MYIKQTEHTNEDYKKIVALSGNVFNSSEWLSIYNNELKVFGIYNPDNKIIGGFHLYFSKLKGLSYIKNPPFTPHIGLFYNNISTNHSSKLSFDKQIIGLVCDFISNQKFKLLTIALPDSVIDTQPFFNQKYKVVPNYTYQLDLEQTKELLYSNLSSDKRTVIKKIEKNEIDIRLENNYQLIFDIVTKTLRNKGKSTNSKLLNKILFQYANSNNSFAYTTYHNNIPSSTAFFIHDNKCAYYLLGGTNPDNKNTNAGIASLWKGVEHAKQLNLKTFDFEGSMLPEVEKFFRGFGGNLTPYYTINKANLILEMAIKMAKRQIF